MFQQHAIFLQDTLSSDSKWKHLKDFEKRLNPIIKKTEKKLLEYQKITIRFDFEIKFENDMWWQYPLTFQHENKKMLSNA